MSNSNIAIIIQARVGSKRLPGKMLLEINGYKIIEWVIERVKLSRKAVRVILATSINSENDILEEIAKIKNISVFRGSENDLLNRYYECAKKFSADIIVRVCADNPLISFELIDWTIDGHIAQNAEYTFSGSNEITKWSDGFGCEVCNFDLLERLEKLDISIAEREHVFQYIWNNQDKFKINYFCAPEEYQFPNIKLDIDYQKDYEFMKRFIETKKISFSDTMNEIIGKYKLLNTQIE